MLHLLRELREVTCHIPRDKWLLDYCSRHDLHATAIAQGATVASPFKARLLVAREHILGRLSALMGGLVKNPEGAVNEELFRYMRDTMIKCLTDKEEVDCMPLRVQEMVKGLDLESLTSVMGALLDHLSVWCAFAMEKYLPKGS